MPITRFDLDPLTAGVNAEASYVEQQTGFTPLDNVVLSTTGGETFEIDQVIVRLAGAQPSETLSLNAAALAEFVGIWSYDSASGVLTMATNGLDDDAWTTILNNVVYYNSSDAPLSPRRLIVTVIDTDTAGDYYDSLGQVPPVIEPPDYDIVGGGNADFAQGGPGGQAIDGGDGNDTVYGDGQSASADDGNDLLNGRDDNDQLTGGGADDGIIGGIGNDRIYGDYQSPSAYDGDDLVDAGDGNDLAVGGNGEDAIAGGTGNDELQGDFDFETAGGADLINGGAGTDTIEGGAADDELVGGDGDDTIYGDYRFATGSDGDDVIAGGAGDDTIFGGGGSGDVVAYVGARNEYEIVQNADGSFTVTDMIAGRDGTDTVREVESFHFADGDIPSSEVVTSPGGGGSGSIETAVARLTIDIPFVNDAPDDIVFAGSVAENSAVGTTVDTALGHDPDEESVTYSLIDDAGGRFEIDPDTGEVTVAGALNYETAASHVIEIEITDAAGASFSERFSIAVTDVIDNPTVFLTPNPDQYDVSNSADNFTLYALASDDVVATGSGNDLIDGGGGDDTLGAGAGNDRLYGRDGLDRLFGLDGDDLLYGNDGNDVLLASAGADRLHGGGGDDNLQGSGGNDVLIGNRGADTMVGGAGNDIYHVDENDTVRENAGGGADIVRAGIDYVLGDEFEELFIGGGARSATGNGAANTLHGSGSSNTLAGLAGNDILRGGGGRDALDGGDGDDLLGGGVGKDTLTGGAGRDVFLFRDGDMGANRLLADMITDFSQADGEKIQLQAVDARAGTGGDQAFAFIGSDAFTGTAGELRYEIALGNTWISADTDGDSLADWVIGVTGSVDLTAADFVL